MSGSCFSKCFPHIKKKNFKNVEHTDSYCLWCFWECHRGSTGKPKIGFPIRPRACKPLSALSQSNPSSRSRTERQQSGIAGAGDGTTQWGTPCLNHHLKCWVPSSLLPPHPNPSPHELLRLFKGRRHSSCTVGSRALAPRGKTFLSACHCTGNHNGCFPTLFCCLNYFLLTQFFCTSNFSC